LRGSQCLVARDARLSDVLEQLAQTLDFQLGRWPSATTG